MSEFGHTIFAAYAVEGTAIDLGRGVHADALRSLEVASGVFGMLRKRL